MNPKDKKYGYLHRNLLLSLLILACVMTGGCRGDDKKSETRQSELGVSEDTKKEETSQSSVPSTNREPEDELIETTVYENAQAGYKVTYPAIFSKENKDYITEETKFFSTEDGINLFSISHTMIDDGNITINDYVQQLKNSYEDGVVLLQKEDEVRFSQPYGDGMTLVLDAIVNKKGIFQWEMNYKTEKAKDFEALFDTVHFEIQ